MTGQRVKRRVKFALFVVALTLILALLIWVVLGLEEIIQVDGFGKKSPLGTPLPWATAVATEIIRKTPASR